MARLIFNSKLCYPKQAPNKWPHCRICDFTTSVRRPNGTNRTISKVKYVTREEQVAHGQIGIDIHADTIVFGSNFTPMQYSGRECDVSPYTDAYESINSVPIATAGTAWTSTETGETYILVFHEGLCVGYQMEHSLLNPNQL